MMASLVGDPFLDRHGPLVMDVRRLERALTLQELEPDLPPLPLIFPGMTSRRPRLMRYLLDTGILIRIPRRTDPLNADVRDAIRRLSRRGDNVGISRQTHSYL